MILSLIKKIIVFLIFILAGSLFWHNLTYVNTDIGRHIKLGEIIWNTGEIPKTNLFSFTAPDFAFINHHWLSEVIFYGILSLGGTIINGLKLIIVFKVLVLLAVYFILFLTVKKNNILAVSLSFLASILVFSARTEPRPEIFSYLIFAAYLLIIYRSRAGGNPVWLWILPILQVFWVNFHIYFIIGPAIYFLFLADRLILKKITKQQIYAGILILTANLINPNFYSGAIYPLRVFDNYGYSVAENSSLFFLAKYFGSWAPQDKLFLVSVFIIAGSFLIRILFNKSVKDIFFDLSLIALTAGLSFKMQRNIPLYALAAWPVLSQNLDLVLGKLSWKKEKLPSTLIVPVFIASIFFVVNGKFYSWLDSPKFFGLNVSASAQEAVEFVKAGDINGQVFNNFDIGSYLIWQLYPGQKVFIDGRPEAYPADFFKNEYRAMQESENIWLDKSDQYGINYVFFAHTDMTQWSEKFLTRINNDKKWPMVFIDDSVVIFLKDTEANRPVIEKYKITKENITEKIPQILEGINKKDANAFINFGNALYRFGLLDGSVRVFETLIANQPDNPYGYQGAGYAYAGMNKLQTQKKAAENMQKAIDLGFKTSNNYFILGITAANTGNFIEAGLNLEKALKLDPENLSVKSALDRVRNIQNLR